MENSERITDGNNQSLPWTDLSVLSCSQNQSPPEQHPSKEPCQDCFIASDIPRPPEAVPKGPEGALESTDVVESKTDPSDVYSTVASPLDTDTLHQQLQEECFINKAAECLDTDPQTAEVTEKQAE